LGGILAAVVFFRVRKIPFGDHADAFALGVAPGWGIARIGCFTVHDHPGVHTAFPLAVRFPDGPRHDLGLYEAIVLFSIGALLWAFHRRDVLRGRLLAVLALLYGIARFFLDFLRATDVAYADGRIHGLTFAQYFAVGLVAWSVWAFVRYRPPGFAAAAGR
jgi:phosphatidylglycerol:prolipoprotein diacylglycerol transferase